MALLGMDFTCALESLRDGRVPDRDCVLPLLSKLVGYCLIAASTTVKLPQILKILKHRSASGLSMLSFELDVVGYTIALAYCLHKGLHFSAYGELVFLLIQSIILVAIIYYYSQPLGAKTWTKTALYCALAPTILSGKVDPVLFEALYTKSTGQLSYLTYLINFGGCMVVLGSLRTVATNGTILIQIIIYRKSHEQREKKIK
ncbi:mannose-P-dolichol utilization defect 1 protein homolog 2-like isoform X4 [Rhodamnia argentea]|uniref:Mannose-P-dolichol utilization defect 1 protein homolog 2-like isoform X4 n=1 Tax=Rhodamnia argentea TaxID=178133 RepID=A0ABM3H3Y6_9MYRT|nr:mannose-P-dolichol utilization defect 1 protein homolog 2-like isoform X4 [Rhodamnia argentea]